MNGKNILIVVLIGIIALGGIAGAIFLGLGPAPGGGDGDSSAVGGGSTDTDTPYAETVIVQSTDTESGTNDGGSESGDESTQTGGDTTESGGGDSTTTASGGETMTATPTEQPDPFAFVIDNISECGDTCRIVNASIINQQNEPATGVTVRSEIYTGGDKIWEGSSDVGTIEAGEEYTDTKRVELSLAEAYKVEQNDGEILIKTFVETDETVYVFNDERNVN